MDATDIMRSVVIPRVAYTSWLVMSTLTELAGGTRLAVIRWSELKQKVARSGPQVRAALAALDALGYARALFPIYRGGDNAIAAVAYEVDPDYWTRGASGLAFDLGNDAVAARILEALVEARLDANRQRDSVSGMRKREFILHRDGGRCRYCGSARPSTLDHVQPAARGGSNSIANLVACCAGCNNLKGCRTPEEAGMALLPAPGAAEV